MGSTIGEPYQLYLSSTFSQKTTKNNQGIYCTHNHSFPGYATVTAQADGIHVWDLQNLHAVASYSVGEHVEFSAPAVSLAVTESGSRSVISYAVLGLAPDISKADCGRTIWVIKQSLSGSRVATSEKNAVVVPFAPIRIYATTLDSLPLLFVSKKGSLSLTNARVDIKSQLEWPGERKHLETFIFPRKSCGFIHDDSNSKSDIAIICCQTTMTLHLRLVLLGEDIVPVGTCEVSIASSTSDIDIGILGLSCSPSGVFSFADSRGIWATYQLSSVNSSFAATPLCENLSLHRFASLNSKKPSSKQGFSFVSLGASLVLLAALVEGTQDIALQIWDLSYGVLLANQSMPLPSNLPSPYFNLAVADAGHVLLTMSSAQLSDKKKASPPRSSIYIIPVDSRLKSNLAAALGKTAQTAAWLKPKTPTLSGQKSGEDDKEANLISTIQASLQNSNALKAEETFMKWVNSHSSIQSALGHEFVKKIFNIVIPPEPHTNYPYTPRIIRYLLENATISTIMLNGRLISTLRQRGDWENLMLALATVSDISEDELMASAKFLVDRQRKNEHAMQVDSSEGYVPPLGTYLSACVSYSFSAPAMRLAIRKYLSDAQDLVEILEIVESWIHGGTEQEMETLLKSIATKNKMESSGIDSPPYPKTITFLQALLDASFVALLQYQPSHELLRRTLAQIEPEIAFIDSMEQLRGSLDPFTKVHMLKDKTGPALGETPAEWRKRRKVLEQQAALGVGLYRLEELVI